MIYTYIINMYIKVILIGTCSECSVIYRYTIKLLLRILFNIATKKTWIWAKNSYNVTLYRSIS